MLSAGDHNSETTQLATEAVQQLRGDFGSQGTVQVALEMFAEGTWPQQVRQAAALAVASLCCRHPEHQRLFRKAEVSPTQCVYAVQRWQQLSAPLCITPSAGQPAIQGASTSSGR